MAFPAAANPVEAFPEQAELGESRQAAAKLGEAFLAAAKPDEVFSAQAKLDEAFLAAAKSGEVWVQWCLSQFQEEGMPDELIFNGMFNVIHIDEKWFYRTRKSYKFYLALDEPEPERVTQNKNYIEKVMFLAAVARPRYDVDGTKTFDGRISIWPFTFEEAAKRDSPIRLKGTMVTKLVTSVTKDVSREWLVNKVLPAIKEKWPVAERGRTIYIQQDNAKSHIDPNGPIFLAAATADGWDIRLVCQPPNSPDLNILDLGFFADLQLCFTSCFQVQLMTLC
ncbi:hypothetical protein ACQ4PT_021640 [Festuca glaucescens]